MGYKEKLAEIEALQAMIDSLPDSEPTGKLHSYQSEGDPEEITEITFRRKVKRRHFSTLKTELVCECCGVTFYKHLPTHFEGRLCGENCATITLEQARELLAPHYPLDALPPPLRAITPEHLRGPMRPAEPSIEDTEGEGEGEDSEPEYEPESTPAEPLTLAEKIRMRLQKTV